MDPRPPAEQPQEAAPVVARPMRLTDLMLLIAAAAVGLAWLRVRSYSTAEFGLFQQRNPDAVEWAGLLGPLYQARWLATPILAPLTIAVGLLWLLPPRPGLARQVRRAGWVVAPLVAVVFGLQWAIVGGHSALHEGSTWWVMETSATYGQNWAGPSIVMAWAALALVAVVVPRPRERSWLDSTGRGLGLAWVVVWLIGLLGPACVLATPVLARTGLMPTHPVMTRSAGISLGGPRIVVAPARSKAANVRVSTSPHDTLGPIPPLDPEAIER